MGTTKASPLPAGVAAQTDALGQTGRLSDEPVKIPLDPHTASSWMRVSGFPSLQAKQWVCRGLGQRTKATWTGLWSRSQMPGFQLHDSRWDFPGPQPNLKHGGSVAQSCLTLVTPWTVARQAPLSMGFPRQEYWSGSPCPPPGDLPDPGIKPRSPALQAGTLLTEGQ